MSKTYDNGRFVWFEFVGSDLDAAQSYYCETLPWKVSSMDMGGGQSYSMIMVGENSVGGFAPKRMEGVPTHWASYLSVEDVDATAKKVVAAGGKTLAEAFDIPNVGRIQPVADPQGGTLLLFRAAQGDSDKLEADGTFHWNELWAQDPKQALAFYEEVFGYTHEKMDMSDRDYYVIKNGDKMRGGIMQSPIPNAPAMWMPYVRVADCDATVKRANGNGGSLAGEPMHVPGVGRFAVLKDPQGGHLAVITPDAAAAE